MESAMNLLLSLLDVSTSFFYWLLGRSLLEEEIKRIKNLFIRVRKPEDEFILLDELNHLSSGKDLLLVSNKNNHNLIQWCVLNNYVQALEILLKYGCNPTRTGLSSYDIPLALACCLNNIEIIKLLLNYGANCSQTTLLTTFTLEYLSEKTNQENYLKLIDLLKYETTITSLSIVLTFDDLTMFRLLTNEITKQRSPSVSVSSTSSLSLMNMMHTIDDLNKKVYETDFYIYHNQLEIENYIDKVMPSDCVESVEQHQQCILNDNQSDYIEHEHFSSSDILSGIVDHRHNPIQTLSEKPDQDETFMRGGTTDCGYFTVDGSLSKVKVQSQTKTINEEQLYEIDTNENKQNLCSIQIEQFNNHSSKQIYRAKSQLELRKLSQQHSIMHRYSLPIIHDHITNQQSKRFHSISSLFLSDIPNSTKHIADVLRLLYQIIECEAATVLEYFLKKHQDEFNNYFYTAANSSDMQLKPYELLSNIKSDRIYNVFASSNCAFLNSVTTSLCDRENNTLVHSLLGQNPLKYRPIEMIKMLERYMAHGLKEFINRPNLSNHCMIQILLCNEHFLKILFFLPSPQSLSKTFNIDTKSMTPLELNYDYELVEKWTHSYLILIEILIRYGARIDTPAGSNQNSLDCLLSSLINLAKRLKSITTIFNIKYLRKLIWTLLSLNSISRKEQHHTIYFKYSFERLIQLLHYIYINNDDLSDVLSLISLLLQYEYQPLRLNTSTLMKLFKLWIINPNFLCSSLVDKDLFMQQFLIVIVNQLGLTVPKNSQFNDNTLILTATTTNNLSWKSSSTLNNKYISLQNLFIILLNLLSLTQTCLQIHSIYELILIFLNHTAYDVINNDTTPLPIVYICSQVKIDYYYYLLRPFLDLFIMIHSTKIINKTKMTFSQISFKRLSNELYKYFLSIEKSKRSISSLRYISTKYLYHYLQKPFIHSVKKLPISKSLQQRLIDFRDI